MNPTIAKFAREKIKEGLAQLPTGHQETFKLMYGRGKITRGIAQYSVEETKVRPMEEVLPELPDEKLDWALTQVENSLKNAEKIPNLLCKPNTETQKD